MLLAPEVGFEPTAYRLTAGCSTVELLWNISINRRRPILPGGLPPKYFWRWKALLLCSRWIQVFPFRFNHQIYLFKFFIEHSKLHTVYIKILKTRSSPRSISTCQLNTLLHFHLRPIYQMVFLEPYSINLMGNLISWLASRLDAFSAYPAHT